tara:strand:- start:2207 stop:2845 length:639 start_codon:yes stop_codon:yes gene_type:complete
MGKQTKKKKKRYNKTKKMNKKIKPRRKNGIIFFSDYPDFTPNLTPRQMFKMGSFGGTYWRPIKSKYFKTDLKNQHKDYPKSWWKGIPEEHLTKPFNKYDKEINKYGVKVGTTLQFWEKKNWIQKTHPYGWVQWYCDFYMGKRSKDDEYQIGRWKGLAGPNGRFRKWLVTIIKKKKGKWNDYDISPAIRQTLQHWGYQLKKKDYDNEIRSRRK